MKRILTKKELVLLIITFIFGLADCFVKVKLESFTFVVEQSGNNQLMPDIVAANYLLTLSYLLMFVLFTVFIVNLIRISIRADAFLSLYYGEQHGEINDLEKDVLEEKALLVDRFDSTISLLDKIDTLVIACAMCTVSFLFCSIYDGFEGLRLWGSDPALAAKYSFFPTWAFDAMFVPNIYFSNYAVNWQVIMLAIMIGLGIFAYAKYYKAAAAFFSVFPDVPKERLSVIELKLKMRKTVEPETRFSTDFDNKVKETNMYIRQEDIDKEEDNFFAAKELPPPMPVVADMSENAGDNAGNSENEELIPAELDLSGLKLQPKEQDKGEDLIPCPMCGSLNPQNAEECFFCGVKIDK